MKALATQTGTSVTNIQTRIERIQKSTEDSVQTPIEVSRKLSGISQTRAASVDEQTATMQEIACIVNSVNQLSRQGASGADQIRAAGDALSGMSKQLISRVGEFKID